MTFPRFFALLSIPSLFYGLIPHQAEWVGVAIYCLMLAIFSKIEGKV